MLSQDRGPFVEESVRSVLAQTYTNWELLFVDDNSQDDTISLMMEMKEKEPRIRVSKTVSPRGDAVNRNSALREARGRWIAFLDAGDLWEPTKLERQIAFMEGHGHAFSYTKFRMIDSRSRDKGIVLGGPERIDNQGMLKCCWLGYATVMYDQTRIGRLQVRYLRENNDYALWLMASEKAECHLLDECLAVYRMKESILHKILFSDKFHWRYSVYRTVEDLGPFHSTIQALRNICYSSLKWTKYAKRG